MTDDGGPRLRVGLIGDPVAHSLSPAVQQAAFDTVSFPATYELWPTPAADLPARIASLREFNVLGANVTVPHKVAVMTLLDEVSPLALRAGAVNTIVNRQGTLLGDNTDVAGFGTALWHAGFDVSHRKTLILGAGGAARAVCLAMEGTDAKPVTIVNRDSTRSERLLNDFGHDMIRLMPWDKTALRDEFASTTLLINATSVGWHGDETPIDLELLDVLPAEAIVIDLTYRDTALLAAARQRGLRTLDGLPMLVHQGAHAFKLWTNQNAPITEMLAAARAARG